jgi:biofilm protein TabA
MIVVDLANLRDQAVLNPRMEAAIAFLQRDDLLDLPVGRELIDGTDVYAEVQAYETVEGGEVRFEGHRQYIDIQYVASGEEIIAYADLKDVTETKSYDEENDYWLGTAPAEKTTLVRLSAGQLAVLYPVDAHAPRRAAGAPTHVRKFVIKVAIN